MSQLGTPAPPSHSPVQCCNSNVATLHRARAIYFSASAPPSPQAVATVMLQLATVTRTYTLARHL